MLRTGGETIFRADKVKTIKFHTTWGVLGSVVLLSACAPSAMLVPTTCATPVQARMQKESKPVPPVQPQRLTAVGYGSTVRDNALYNYGQQKLMAMRAAQLDAYRNLAEQVYGFRLWGTTSIAAFATQNDSIRTHVDAFIRGAKVVNVTSIADGNFEVTVELDLTQAFLSQFTPPETQQPAPAQQAVNTAGCPAPVQPVEPVMLAPAPVSVVPTVVAPVNVTSLPGGTIVTPATVAPSVVTTPMVVPSASCATVGCSQPSVYYYSR